jgi:hypothetical protein
MSLQTPTVTKCWWPDTTNTLDAALAYHQAGLCVIPLNGKHPALGSWKQYQEQRPTEADIRRWAGEGLLQNLGIVCGAVSGNLIVLDFDGLAAYAAFATLFPALAQSYTVATGSGQGKHVYINVDNLPPTTRALDTPIGHIELRSDGTYVAAPPSLHPVTDNRYLIEKPVDILRVPELETLVEWIESFKVTQPPRQNWQPPRNLPPVNGSINSDVIDAIANALRQRRHKERGEWINCSCIYPDRHKNGDRHPSFGFNTESGYGYCYKCGSILAKDICDVLGINPDDHGGLVRRPEVPTIDSRDAAHSLTVQVPQVTEPELTPPDKDIPPIGEIDLPDWLAQYTEWASAAGNQTPVIFHQAAGIWLLSVAIARRLVVRAPWGIQLYPNFYMMFIADTTYYRKTTAFKLAERVIRDTIPHMLMPTPGSPERFQEALSGRLPSNFKDQTYEQQALLSKAQAFAAQRGLFKDEVAGLFGAFNKKDYMVGLKDLIMELYDCPDYADKDTQSGLTIVRKAALSILGVTTPAGLSAATNNTDWDNGLLPRFLMLTPEPDYRERPTQEVYHPAPEAVTEGLKALYERLPMPVQEGDSWKSPAALEMEVECWPEVQLYSDRLRQLCDPRRETLLDDRLKGLYGRMHVQAIKLAMIISALDWMESEKPLPVVTKENWQTAETLAEHWRASAHRLLDQMDLRGAGQDEQRQQERIMSLFRSAGSDGLRLRDVYRSLKMQAGTARQIAYELVRAGLLVQTQIGSAEAYAAVSPSTGIEGQR